MLPSDIYTFPSLNRDNQRPHLMLHRTIKYERVTPLALFYLQAFL